MGSSAPEEITYSLITSADDFHGVVAVEKAAFADFPLMQVVFGPRPTDETLIAASLTTQVAKHTSTFNDDPCVRFMKASLPSGQIIGVGKWYLWTPESVANPFPAEFPPTGNQKLGEYVFGEFWKVMMERMQGKSFVYLHVLAIDPAFQRRGVGKKLCEWGLAEADRLGQEAYVDASPEGRGLYAKLGWEKVHEVIVDLKEYGGPDLRNGCTNMWRPAKGTSV